MHPIIWYAAHHAKPEPEVYLFFYPVRPSPFPSFSSPPFFLFHLLPGREVVRQIQLRNLGSGIRHMHRPDTLPGPYMHHGCCCKYPISVYRQNLKIVTDIIVLECTVSSPCSCLLNLTWLFFSFVITTSTLGCLQPESVEGPPCSRSGGGGLTYAQGPHVSMVKIFWARARADVWRLLFCKKDSKVTIKKGRQKIEGQLL